MKKYELADFEFSQSYLFFWDKIERTNFMLENYISTRNEPLEGRLMAWLLSDPYCDGGQWDMLINLVKKYGVVPKHYFPEVHSSESSRHLNKILTNKVECVCSLDNPPLKYLQIKACITRILIVLALYFSSNT